MAAMAAERTGGPGPVPPTAATGPPPTGTNVTGSNGTGSAARPVRMNLFATWEVDRSSPACVPRLFTLTLQRLVLLRDAAKEPGNVVIAVKLQGSKRILRSNEIPLSGGGAAEAELQLTFSLQYPHFLKRGANRLQVLLQRRKRYKHRPFLGYKTLAVGLIDMAEVLQQPSDDVRLLVLHRALKDTALPVAEIRVRSLNSQPIDHEAKGKAADRSPDMDNYSEEEDEDSFSSEQDGSDDAIQGQDLYDEEEELPKRKKTQRKLLAAAGRQPNIKQKFVALLKRFKVSEEALCMERVSRMRAVQDLAEDLDELCATLGINNPSDSGDIDDTDSGISNTKPRLRPFFEGLSQSSSQTEMGSPGRDPHPMVEVAPTEDIGPDPEGMGARGDPDPHPELGGGPEKPRGATRGSKGEAASPRAQDTGGPTGRGGRGGGTPLRSPRPIKERSQSSDSERSPELSLATQGSRRALTEQLNAVLGAEPTLPDCVLLLSGTEWQGQWLSERLQAHGHAALCVGGAELQAVLAALLGRIHRLSSAPPPRPLKLLAAGPPPFHSSLLRAFVHQLSNRSPDWPRWLRFLLVPLGAPHPVLHYLGSVDGRYAASFLEPNWRELFGRSEAPTAEPFNVAGRILGYAMGANITHLLPVAEAMLTCRNKCPDEDSYQKFVPFVGVVKVGLDEDPPPPPQGEGEEAPPALNLVVPSTSPPRDAIATPPASPSMAASAVGPSGDALGLQVDYWGASREGGAKSSLRGTFRSMQVSRLPPPGEGPGTTLSMTLVTREKNKKVPTLFLSKRPRDPDPKSLLVDGITRLICSPRQPPALLSVSVDGTQWDAIKFFQLTAQWPSHVKHFPVGLFGPKT